MVELPYDKNGEVIYIDDDMVDEFGCQIVVTSIEFFVISAWIKWSNYLCTVLKIVFINYPI